MGCVMCIRTGCDGGFLFLFHPLFIALFCFFMDFIGHYLVAKKIILLLE